MPPPGAPSPSPQDHPQWFATTHWSVVLAAGNAASPQANAALERLGRACWFPIYAFIRRLGHEPVDAQDLTQAFFADVLERNSLSAAHPAKGRFRSFLLGAVQHFLSQERDKARALKRGGQCTFISLDEEDPEGRYRLEPADGLTPETWFERRWALDLLDRALAALGAEFHGSLAVEPGSSLPCAIEFARLTFCL